MATIFIQGIGGGKPEEEKTVALALADGNQVVTPSTGKTLSRVTVEKPTALKPENVKQGVTIAGVAGTYAGSEEPAKPEEEKTVELSLAGGNQVVTPSTGKVLSKVTIEKPVTLIADNIKQGVTIAGVTGTHSGGGVAMPTLNRVTISRSLTSLSISNPSSNGSFVNGYKLYSNGTLVTTISSTSYTLTNLTVGSHTLMVKAKGNNFEDAPESNTVDVRVCSITKNLTNLTISNSVTKLADGNSFTATFTPASGKFLPGNIEITQDGEPATYTYNGFTGELTIPSVDGDIVITAVANDVNAVHAPDVVFDPATAEVSFDGVPFVDTYNVYDDATLLKTYKGISYRTQCAEFSSGTSLSATVKNCVAGDLILAAVATRTTFTPSAGWEVIAASTVVPGDSNSQRITWLKKTATDTQETLTITQASSVRAYITLLAFPSTCTAADNGFTYSSNASSTNVTANKPEGLAVFACVNPNWASGTRTSWKCSSPDAELLDLKTSTQPRLAVFVEDGAAGSRTFTSTATSGAITVGCLTLTNAEEYEFIQGDQDAH